MKRTALSSTLYWFVEKTVHFGGFGGDGVVWGKISVGEEIVQRRCKILARQLGESAGLSNDVVAVHVLSYF